MKLSDKAGVVISQGVTDRDGEAELNLPLNVLYPFGGSVSLSIGDEIIGVAPIKASGVKGLYPGDVWRIQVPSQFAETEKGYPKGM